MRRQSPLFHDAGCTCSPLAGIAAAFEGTAVPLCPIHDAAAIAEAKVEQQAAAHRERGEVLDRAVSEVQARDELAARRAQHDADDAARLSVIAETEATDPLLASLLALTGQRPTRPAAPSGNTQSLGGPLADYLALQGMTIHNPHGDDAA